jgi:hypothetical protein
MNAEELLQEIINGSVRVIEENHGYEVQVLVTKQAHNILKPIFESDTKYQNVKNGRLLWMRYNVVEDGYFNKDTQYVIYPFTPKKPKGTM